MGKGSSPKSDPKNFGLVNGIYEFVYILYIYICAVVFDHVFLGLVNSECLFCVFCPWGIDLLICDHERP